MWRAECRMWAVGCGVLSVGCRLWGVACRVQDVGCGVIGCRVQDVGCGVFKVWAGETRKTSSSSSASPPLDRAASTTGSLRPHVLEGSPPHQIVKSLFTNTNQNVKLTRPSRLHNRLTAPPRPRLQNKSCPKNVLGP